MVFLPEAADFIGPPSTYPSLTTSLEASEFVKGIRDSAKRHNCWVSVGVHERVSWSPAFILLSSV